MSKREKDQLQAEAKEMSEAHQDSYAAAHVCVPIHKRGLSVGVGPGRGSNAMAGPRTVLRSTAAREPARLCESAAWWRLLRGDGLQERAVLPGDGHPADEAVPVGAAPHPHGPGRGLLPGALEQLHGLAGLEAAQRLALADLERVAERRGADAPVARRPRLQVLLLHGDPAALAVGDRGHVQAHRRLGLFLLGSLDHLDGLVLGERAQRGPGVALELGLQRHAPRDHNGASAFSRVDAACVALCCHPALRAILHRLCLDTDDVSGLLVLYRALDHRQDLPLVELPNHLAVLDADVVRQGDRLAASVPARPRRHQVLALPALHREPAHDPVGGRLAAGPHHVADDLLLGALDHLHDLAGLQRADVLGGVGGEPVLQHHLLGRVVAGLGGLLQERRALVALHGHPAALPVGQGPDLDARQLQALVVLRALQHLKHLSELDFAHRAGGSNVEFVCDGHLLHALVVPLEHLEEAPTANAARVLLQEQERLLFRRELHVQLVEALGECGLGDAVRALPGQLGEKLLDREAALLDLGPEGGGDLHQHRGLDAVEGVLHAVRDDLDPLPDAVHLQLGLGHALLRLDPRSSGRLCELDVVVLQELLDIAHRGRELGRCCLHCLLHGDGRLDVGELRLSDRSELFTSLLQLLQFRLRLLDLVGDDVEDQRGRLLLLLVLLFPPLELLPLRVVALALIDLLLELIQLGLHLAHLRPQLRELSLCIRQGASLAIPHLAALKTHQLDRLLRLGLRGADQRLQVLHESRVLGVRAQVRGALVALKRDPS
mmetsp:Transcript_122790/g.347998  ORF Transcript_122790/g.347998 Transcript_122790/m.347998 type:complete len:776 (-) Transcript_122790:1296-3623(-)